MYTRENLIADLDAKDIRNTDLKSKNVLLRACLNVVTDRDGRIIDDTRLREALPTIRYLGENSHSVTVMAHLGRPTTNREREFSLESVRLKLEQELGVSICMLSTESDISNLKTEKNNRQKFYLIENIRFFEGEESKEEAKQNEFARLLSSIADIFVNDAFPDYRKSVSTYNIAKYLPSYLGISFVKEVKAINYFSAPEYPFVAVLGGAKLSEKLDTLRSLLKTADRVLIGGAMAYTLMKFQTSNPHISNKTGNSKVENEKGEVSKEIMDRYSHKILLPQDHIVKDKFEEGGFVEIVDEIPDEKIAVDIGPKTVTTFKKMIQNAGSILWNGPMGVFEWKDCEKGTKQIADAILSSPEAYKFAGGGDTISAINKFGLSGFHHISTGGGALLSYIASNEFPILDVVLDS